MKKSISVIVLLVLTLYSLAVSAQENADLPYTGMLLQRRIDPGEDETPRNPSKCTLRNDRAWIRIYDVKNKLQIKNEQPVVFDKKIDDREIIAKIQDAAAKDSSGHDKLQIRNDILRPDKEHRVEYTASSFVGGALASYADLRLQYTSQPRFANNSSTNTDELIKRIDELCAEVESTLKSNQ